MNRVKLLLYAIQYSIFEKFLRNKGTLFPFKLQKETDVTLEHTQAMLFLPWVWAASFVLLKIYTSN